MAGIKPRIYYRVSDYPDEEAMRLIGALAGKLGVPVDATLEKFGEFIVPDLVRMARYWIKPEWKTLDLIANTEHTVHETLRSEGSQTNPPRLQTERTGAKQVTVTYASPRKLCFLAKGIIAGLASHYGERISMAEPSCMHQGAASCRLVVSLA